MIRLQMAFRATAILENEPRMWILQHYKRIGSITSGLLTRFDNEWHSQ